MRRKYQRPVHQLVGKVKRSAGAERAEAMQELARVKPEIAAALGVKYSFSADNHRKLLELDRNFLGNSNGAEQSILELGAGNGRLAASLTRGKRKFSYTIFDRKYATGWERFPLNREVRRLIKKGLIMPMAGNFYEHDFGSEQWNHILMPASFFPRTPNASWEQTDSDRTELVKKLLPNVKIGGTIRASNLVAPLEQQIKLHSFLRRERDAGRLDFKVTQIESPPEIAKQFGPGTLKGLIITKLREPSVEREGK